MPSHWDKASVRWILARIAVAKDISGSELADSVIELSTDRYRHKNGAPETRAMVNVPKYQDLHRAGGNDALIAFLNTIEVAILAELLPAKVREYLIGEWSGKVQEFWSRRRLGLLKSITTTSNKNWLWYRTLLGRQVRDGKLVDVYIDGNHS